MPRYICCFLKKSLASVSCFVKDLIIRSPLVYWLALCFCDPQVVGTNSVGDGHGNELFGEIALKNQRFFQYYSLACGDVLTSPFHLCGLQLCYHCQH